MKILEVCPFSAGICGVWTRAIEESRRLVENGHEVRIFSSSFIKGTNALAPEQETLGKIKIKRFAAKHLGGESFMKWKFRLRF